MTSDDATDHASIHLRVPRDLKAVWVERSRAEGAKLTDWIARHLNQTANEVLATASLERLINAYANIRATSVARGAETPQLAALLLRKYGAGMADAVTAIFDDASAAVPLTQLVDREVEKLDPQWRGHARDRWEATPAARKYSKT